MNSNELKQRYMKRVDTGIEYLERTAHVWLYNVDTTTLDMEDPDDCIIAQVFDSNYWDAVKELGLTAEQQAQYGFRISYTELEDNDDYTDDSKLYALLSEIWIDRINALRHKEYVHLFPPIQPSMGD